MAKYRTKPCEIEAIQWDGNTTEIKEFCGDKCSYSVDRGLRGEYYPCKPDVFHKKYELVE